MNNNKVIYDESSRKFLHERFVPFYKQKYFPNESSTTVRNNVFVLNSRIRERTFLWYVIVFIIID